jgi:tetratricopeptide (TPR) repeat protein
MNQAARFVAYSSCAATARNPPLLFWYEWSLSDQQPFAVPADTAVDHEPTPYELRLAADRSCIEGDLDTAQVDIAAAIDGYRESADEWGLADALAVKGSIARAAGELDAATRDYRESLSIFNVLGDLPSTIRLYRALGEAIFAAGDYATVIALFLEALSLVPGDPVLLTGLGYASWYETRIADALTYLAEALDAEPSNQPALIARGQVEVEAGRPERALPDLDRALALLAQGAAAEEADVHSARALALAQLGKAVDAEAELGTALSLQPRRAQTFLRAAQIRLLEEDAKAARSLLEDALATTPPLPPSHAARARSLLELLPRLWVDNLHVTSLSVMAKGAAARKS